MEQRRLRLGDILDDYCPRERRLTNHAVVAMIEEDVKQTRCTTCDAEHAYKGGKVPKRRKKETTAALYKEVLAGQLASEAAPIAPDADPDDPEAPDALSTRSGRSWLPLPVDATPVASSRSDEEAAPAVAEHEEHDEPSETPPEVEEGPVHRPLIRAQLPRIEGQKEERRAAGVHDSSARRQRSFPRRQRMKPHRHGGNGHAGGANGNRAHGGSRFAGQRPAGPAAAVSRPGAADSRDSVGQRQGGGAEAIAIVPPIVRGLAQPRAFHDPATASRRQPQAAAMTDLANKTGLIVGVANKRSISWAIAQAASAAAPGSPSPIRASGSKRTSASSPTGSDQSADPPVRRDRRRADRARIRGDRSRVRRARLSSSTARHSLRARNSHRTSIRQTRREQGSSCRWTSARIR